MGAWPRNIGLLFIVGGGLATLQACPPPDWHGWPGLRAPLAGPRLMRADATFTAPQTATYFVQVKLPPNAKGELINTLVRPQTGERGKPIFCGVYSQGDQVPVNGYQENSYPLYDGPSYTIGSFTGRAGSSYAIQAQLDHAPSAFVKARPFVQINYNPVVEHRQHRHPGQHFLSALCLVAGLLLTFWYGSRLPLRALFPRA